MAKRIEMPGFIKPQLAKHVSARTFQNGRLIEHAMQSHISWVTTSMVATKEVMSEWLDGVLHDAQLVLQRDHDVAGTAVLESGVPWHCR